jgi:ribosome-binding factor A
VCPIYGKEKCENGSSQIGLVGFDICPSTQTTTPLNGLLQTALKKHMIMESIRQKQVAETVKRHFSIVLQQEANYMTSEPALITVTNVKMTPDLSIAKVYLSIYNTENKQETLLELEDNMSRLRQALGSRLRNHVRRIPELDLFIDDTLDEMYRLNALFDKLEDENQMGSDSDEE